MKQVGRTMKRSDHDAISILLYSGLERNSLTLSNISPPKMVKNKKRQPHICS